MIDSKSLKTILDYKAWADELLYQAVAPLPVEELEKQRPMLFGNILSILNHVYSMDLVWQLHLQGRPHDFQTRNPQPPSTFSMLRENQILANNWYKEYVENLRLDSYHEAISFTFIGGGEGRMTRLEILQHAVNHSTYHRGHIGGVFYQMNIEPPTTDLPVYLREISQL